MGAQKLYFYKRPYISYTTEYHSNLSLRSLPSFDQGTSNSVPLFWHRRSGSCTVLGEIPLLEILRNLRNAPSSSKARHHPRTLDTVE